jgi:carbon monoxide dehydrogenase subunit G
MQFTTKEDIEAPIAFVWQHATDFAAFERQALRRGADVIRRDAQSRVGVGSGWDIRFNYRGKERKLKADIAKFEQPNSYTILTSASGIDGVTVVDLVALSRGRTRLSVTVDVSAQSLAARLMLQSLKLAKTSLNRRFTGRIQTMAEAVRERYRRQQAET